MNFYRYSFSYLFSSFTCKLFFWQKQPPEVFCKKMFLQMLQNAQENILARIPFFIKLQASTYSVIKKETLAQLFSCEFCEILKKTFLTEHLLETASVFIEFSSILFCLACDNRQFYQNVKNC